MKRVVDLSTLRWPRLFSQYFYRLEGEDLGLWQVELERIYEAEEETVISAIRAMAAEPKPPKYPKIGNLKHHIFEQINNQRSANTVPAEPCGLCHPVAAGCIYQTVDWPEMHKKPFELFTPCACSLGMQEARRWAKDSSRPDDEVYDTLHRRALRIRDHRQAGYSRSDPMPMGSARQT